jgi:hypothetical protein
MSCENSFPLPDGKSFTLRNIVLNFLLSGYFCGILIASSMINFPNLLIKQYKMNFNSFVIELINDLIM